MKIVITWLHKNGKCRSWTNATPCEHTAMSLTAYTDSIKRLAKRWGVTPMEAGNKITKIIEKENFKRERTREDFGRDRKRAEQLRG